MGTRSAVAPVKNQSLWRLPQMRQLLAISLLGFTSFCLTLAAVPTWAHAGGVAESAAGLPTTVMLASTVLTQAAVPRLVTRFGVGRTLAAGLVALGAPAPFCALSHQLAVLLPVAAVRGCGFAVLTVVGVTLTATVAPPDRHGESVGLYGLAIAVPNLLGIPAGVALTQLGGFGWVASGAAIPVLAVPLALSPGRSIERHADNSRATVSSSLSARRTVAVVLAPAMVLLVVTLAGGGLITYLAIQRPSGVFATVVLLLFGATAALARWRVGAIADRVGTTVLLPCFGGGRGRGGVARCRGVGRRVVGRCARPGGCGRGRGRLRGGAEPDAGGRLPAGRSGPVGDSQCCVECRIRFGHRYRCRGHRCHRSCRPRGAGRLCCLRRPRCGQPAAGVVDAPGCQPGPVSFCALIRSHSWTLKALPAVLPSGCRRVVGWPIAIA